MKKLLLLLFIALIACNNDQKNNDGQKQAIIDYLQEDAKGVKTDYQIEILQLEISNVTVADSIAIIENKFQEEEAKVENSAENFKNSIEKAAAENEKLDRSNMDNLAKISANKSASRMFQQGLEKAESTLVKIQERKSSTLKKYEDRDKDQLLVKKAKTTFSFFNPSLQTRQERTDYFVLSKDGLKVLGIVSKGKFRHKK